MASITSSSANSIYSSLATNNKGIGGLVSGLDTESIVESLLLGTKNKIAKQQQLRQTAVWQQTAYRGIAESLRGFQSTYFKYASAKGTNMLAESNTFWNVYKATSSDSSVKVNASTNATPGSFTIKEVEQLATNRQVASDVFPQEFIGKDVRLLQQDYTGQTLRISLNDGLEQTIALDSLNDVLANPANNTDALKAAAVQAELKQLVSDKFGLTVYCTVAEVGLPGSGDYTVKFGLASNLSGNKLTVTNDCDILGFSAQQSNRINTAMSLADIFGSSLQTAGYDEDIIFSINGTEISAKASESLKTVMNRINNSVGAKATITFDSVKQIFTITAKDAGGGDTLVMKDVQGNFLNQLLGIQGGSTFKTEDKKGTYGYQTSIDGLQFNLTGYTSGTSLDTVGTIQEYITNLGVGGTAKMNIVIDGTEYEISFTIDATDISNIADELQDFVDAATGGTLATMTAAEWTEYAELNNKLYTNLLGQKITDALTDKDELGSDAGKVKFYIDEFGQCGFGTSSETRLELRITTDASVTPGSNSDLFAKLGYTSSPTVNFSEHQGTNIADMDTTKNKDMTSSGSFVINIYDATGTTIVDTQTISWDTGKVAGVNASLWDLCEEINNHFGEGTASIVNGCFVLDFGDDIVELQDIGANGFVECALGANGYKTDIGGTLNVVEKGQNAKIIMEDGSILHNNSNTISINGVSVTISEVTTTPITITVGTDVTDLVDRIQDFIDDYNALISEINGYIYEEKNSDYEPLTEDQKRK